MDDISDPSECDKGQVKPTMLAREEYARSMGTAEKLDNQDVYRRKPDLVQATDNKLSVMSLSKWDSFSEHAGLTLGAWCLACTDVSCGNVYRTSILVYQNVVCRTVSPLDMVFLFVAALSIWKLEFLNKYKWQGCTLCTPNWLILLTGGKSDGITGIV